MKGLYKAAFILFLGSFCLALNAQTWTPIFYMGAPTATDTVDWDAINDFSFLDDNNGVVLVEGGYIYTTTNGGSGWGDRITVGAVANPSGAVCYPASSTIITGAYNTIFKSTNSGATSSQVTNGLFAINDMAFSGNFGIALGGACGLAYTTDGGANWNNVTAPTVCGNNSAMWHANVVNSTTAYIGGKNSKFFKTTDAGANWSALSPSASFGVEAISFADVNTGYIITSAGSSGSVLKTTDGGANWSDITANTGIAVADLVNNRARLVAVSATTLYIISHPATGIGSGKISVSTDGGATFTQDFTLPVVSGSTINPRIKVAGNSVFALTMGRKLFKHSLTATAINQTESPATVQVFPNPSNGVVTVTNVPAGANLHVINMAGQQVYNTVTTANTHTIAAGTLNAGVYILQIENSGALSTQKLVINK